MTALRVLDEIRARLAAATAGPWRLDNVDSGAPGGDPCGALFIGGRPVAFIDDMEDSDADLIAHAPADLALLEAIVREMAEAECEECSDCTKAWPGDRAKWCWPCRVRHELAKGGRAMIDPSPQDIGRRVRYHHRPHDMHGAGGVITRMVAPHAYVLWDDGREFCVMPCLLRWESSEQIRTLVERL